MEQKMNPKKWLSSKSRLQITHIRMIFFICQREIKEFFLNSHFFHSLFFWYEGALCLFGVAKWNNSNSIVLGQRTFDCCNESFARLEKKKKTMKSSFFFAHSNPWYVIWANSMSVHHAQFVHVLIFCVNFMLQVETCWRCKATDRVSMHVFT